MAELFISQVICFLVGRLIGNWFQRCDERLAQMMY